MEGTALGQAGWAFSWLLNPFQSVVVFLHSTTKMVIFLLLKIWRLQECLEDTLLLDHWKCSVHYYQKSKCHHKPSLHIHIVSRLKKESFLFSKYHLETHEQTLSSGAWLFKVTEATWHLKLTSSPTLADFQDTVATSGCRRLLWRMQLMEHACQFQTFLGAALVSRV